MTVGQIDAIGVKGPHEKELEDISNAKYPLFINLDEGKLKDIVIKDIGGIIENIGMNEDWTITIEMFPAVNIHMSFTYYGDEFGDDLEAEFKFYFSGEHVSWVPGEDSATFIDIILDFLEIRLKGNKPFEKAHDTKSELMEKVLLQREEPFKLLKDSDKKGLEEFLGAKVWKTDSGWRIKKDYFPEIYIEILWHQVNGLDISFSGPNLEKISSYHLELVGIFMLNHILRYIVIQNEDKELPPIAYIMFSRYFTKQRNWDHRRT